MSSGNKKLLISNIKKEPTSLYSRRRRLKGNQKSKKINVEYGQLPKNKQAFDILSVTKEFEKAGRRGEICRATKEILKMKERDASFDHLMKMPDKHYSSQYSLPDFKNMTFSCADKVSLICKGENFNMEQNVQSEISVGNWIELNKENESGFSHVPKLSKAEYSYEDDGKRIGKQVMAGILNNEPKKLTQMSDHYTEEVFRTKCAAGIKKKKLNTSRNSKGRPLMSEELMVKSIRKVTFLQGTLLEALDSDEISTPKWKARVGSRETILVDLDENLKSNTNIYKPRVEAINQEHSRQKFTMRPKKTPNRGGEKRDVKTTRILSKEKSKGEENFLTRKEKETFRSVKTEEITLWSQKPSCISKIYDKECYYFPKSSNRYQRNENRSKSPTGSQHNLIKCDQAQNYKIKTSNDGGKTVYLDVCKKEHIVPSSIFLQQIGSSVVDLEYYCLCPEEVKAVSIGLMFNRTVTELCLSYNAIDESAAHHIGQLIRANTPLKKLVMSHCGINMSGAYHISCSLRDATNIEILDLSFNEIGDRGLDRMVDGIQENTSLKSLCLAGNHLTWESTEALGKIFHFNTSILHLNLSTNLIHKGLKNFLPVLIEKSTYFTSLNMARNKLRRMHDAEQVKNLFKLKYFRYLDLSFNRFQGLEKIQHFGTLLQYSRSIKHINLSNNPLTEESAISLIESVPPDASIKTILLKSIWVAPKYENKLKEFKKRQGLHVVIGGIKHTSNPKTIDMGLILLRRMHYLGKKSLNQPDFGVILLKIEKKLGKLAPIMLKKFVELMGIAGFSDLTIGLSFALGKCFLKPVDGRNQVDLKEMLDAYMALYPNTKLPVKVKHVSKKGHVIDREKESNKELELMLRQKERGWRI